MFPFVLLFAHGLKMLRLFHDGLDALQNAIFDIVHVSEIEIIHHDLYFLTNLQQYREEGHMLYLLKRCILKVSGVRQNE